MMKAADIMTTDVVNIRGSATVAEARLFANTGIRRAPVIKGELLGIISVTDILTKSDFVEQPKEVVFEQAIQQAIENARRICAEEGPTSADCAVAWDAVEEMQAEAAHQRAKKYGKTAFEEYCQENPDAFEARIYDS